MDLAAGELERDDHKPVILGESEVDQVAKHLPPYKRLQEWEVNDPNPTSFELQLNSETAIWLACASSANV
jgi:hypothetical protein